MCHCFVAYNHLSFASIGRWMHFVRICYNVFMATATRDGNGDEPHRRHSFVAILSITFQIRSVHSLISQSQNGARWAQCEHVPSIPGMKTLSLIVLSKNVVGFVRCPACVCVRVCECVLYASPVPRVVPFMEKNRRANVRALIRYYFSLCFFFFLNFFFFFFFFCFRL